MVRGKWKENRPLNVILEKRGRCDIIAILMAKNSMYLYGKNSVLERLKANPKSIKRIFIQDKFDSQHILNVIDSTDISVKRVSERELAKIKRADRLQGIVAEIERFEYASW